MDDAIFMRMHIRKSLGEEHTYFEASTGREGIREYKKCKPDLVIMDITMPDMNGILAVEGIREYDRTAKIIMCSAMGQQRKIIAAIKAGALNFIVKPFTQKEICDVVEKTLAMVEMEAANVDEIEAEVQRKMS